MLDAAARHNAEILIPFALAEDLATGGDVTSQLLIPADEIGRIDVVCRRSGCLAGVPLVEMVFEQLTRLDKTHTVPEIVTQRQDGGICEPGTAVATLSGHVRTLLTAERTVLNFLTHLSGIASLTYSFVQAVAGTGALILDTRKTLPGWRHLQKYAVRCGGGTNHRLGLYDAVLIKDNHLAAWQRSGKSLAAAVGHCRRSGGEPLTVEVEVDTLEQLRDVLAASPEIVLLDNMPVEQLRQAVSLRNERAPHVLLEASGGIDLQTVRGVAESGVDRISVGALTHSAPTLDLAFDWSTLRPGS